MASKEAIGMMREQALNGITDATGKIAAALDVDAPEIPTQGKDADLLYAQQLTAIADYLAGVATYVTRRTAAIATQDGVAADVVENEPPVADKPATQDGEVAIEQELGLRDVVENEPPVADKPATRRRGR